MLDLITIVKGVWVGMLLTIKAITKTPSDIVQAKFHSCVGPGADVWLLVHPTTPTFIYHELTFL